MGSNPTTSTNLIKGNTMSYIYCITNIINGKKYIGKTADTVENRFKQHVRDSKKVRSEKRPLYSAMNKYASSSCL